MLAFFFSVDVFFLCGCHNLGYEMLIYWYRQLYMVVADSQHSVWVDDAFDRARQLYLSYYRSIPKSLERATAHKLMTAMLNGDERFVEPTPQSLQNLTLNSVKDAVMNQFVGGNMEVHNYLLLTLNIISGYKMSCHLKGACLYSSGKYCWGLLRAGD